MLNWNNDENEKAKYSSEVKRMKIKVEYAEYEKVQIRHQFEKKQLPHI